MPESIAEVIYLVAIAIVWSRGTIFRWVRTHGPRVWVALADCPLCSGVWIGGLGALVFDAAPRAMLALGRASLVGVLTLAVCAAIRRL